MNNSDFNLLKLLDIIRNDPGINNAIDAMEQLSLLLILKYLHHVTSSGLLNQRYFEKFSAVILNSNIIYNGKIESNFSKLTTVLHTLALNTRNSGEEPNNGVPTSKVISSYEALITAIPFRIRSIRILEMLLFQLEMIEFDDSLVEVYDGLIIKMINDSIASGAFHSPKALVSAIVKAVNPLPTQSIYDPALGTGRFIIEAKKFILKKHGSPIKNQLCVFGQDISQTAGLIGTLNLLINDIDISNVFVGDSLTIKNNLTYDIIMSGIPFGKTSIVDRYENNYYGDSSNLEVMFLKLTMEKLAENGKAALIVPDGLLFTRSNELKVMRHHLLTRFNLHSILSLPIGAVAPYTGVKVSVLFFEKTKAGSDIWFYKLSTDKSFNKSNQISDFDLMEFSELFPKRTRTENSYLINKSEVLKRDFFDLSFELPIEKDEQNELSLPNELLNLNENKRAIDALWIKLTESLAQHHETEFSKKKTLGDIFTLRTGTPPDKTYVTDQGEYPIYGGNGIIGYCEQYNRIGENLIIGRVGANCGNVHIVSSPIWLTDNSFTVQVNDSVEVYLPYLAHVLRSMDLRKLARGSAQPSISNSTIKNLEISLPSYKKQIELSRWLDEIQMKNYELQKLIQSQRNKFEQLTSFVISRNCIM